MKINWSYIIPALHGFISIFLLAMSFVLHELDHESTIKTLSETGELAYILFLIVALINIPGGFTVGVIMMLVPDSLIYGGEYLSPSPFMMIPAIVITNLYIFLIIQTINRFRRR